MASNQSSPVLYSLSQNSNHGSTWSPASDSGNSKKRSYNEDSVQNVLTIQQREIIAHAAPPEIKQKRILRITAGAGTGKTTTLIEYAKKLSLKGHRDILYLTFNKSSQRDAELRFNRTSYVTVKTLHSQAFQCIGASEMKCDLLDDAALDRWILNFFADEIDYFLRDMPNSNSAEKWQRRRMERKVTLYIRKTLNQFLISAMNPEECKFSTHMHNLQITIQFTDTMKYELLLFCRECRQSKIFVLPLCGIP